MGRCVSYIFCKETFGLIDLRKPVDEPCEGYLDVCCEIKNILSIEEVYEASTDNKTESTSSEKIK